MKSPEQLESGTGQAGQADRNFTPRKAIRAIRQRIHHAHARLVRYIADRLNLDQLADVLLMVGFAAGVTDSTRLPAVVDRLKKLGWPISVDTVPEPSRRRDRHVGVWHLPQQYRALAQELSK